MEHILNHCEGIKDQQQQILTESLLSYIRQHEKDYEQKEPEDQKIRSLKLYGLSLLDGWHVLAYTATASGWMNDSAREGKKNTCPCIEVFEAGLTASLDKLSPYHGVSYRMERCDEEGIKSGWFHKNIGRTFCIPYFLSTSTFDYNNNPMVWVIQTSENSNGRYIAEISNSPGEQEVLFRKNSFFEIIDVGLNDQDKVLVYLQELPKATDSTIDLSGLYYRNI